LAAGRRLALHCGEDFVKKELTFPAVDFPTRAALWCLLVGELAVGLVLGLSGKLPPVLVRSLQLFLRF
jgi:hypothetical protein